MHTGNNISVMNLYCDSILLVYCEYVCPTLYGCYCIIVVWTLLYYCCMDVTVLLLYGHYCMTLQVDNMLRMCLLVFGGRLVFVCVVVPCPIIVCAVYLSC